jgi:hypothetical protein
LISLFHDCTAECREATDYGFDRWQIGEMKFRKCPRLELTEDVSGWLYAYRMFKNGFLPNAGGWLEQSNKFIEVMCFIEAKVAEFQREANGRQ